MDVSPRLGRLLAMDGRCFDVAIDHGLFNERVVLAGIEDMPATVTAIAAADPDAIQLSPGQARLLQAIPGRHKPSLVLRSDVANVYGQKLPAVLFNQLIDASVRQALELDAACVVANLLLLPNQPDLHRQCVANICRLRSDCARYGMPLMVEPLVMRPNEEAGGYMVDGDLDKIVPLVRQAMELGADVIKADPCDDPSEYHEVVRAAGGRPVLVRGGGRVTDEIIIARTAEVMRQGASGIVYGRNVIQHANPRGMIRALMAVVHGAATQEEAVAMIQDEPALAG